MGYESMTGDIKEIGSGWWGRMRRKAGGRNWVRYKLQPIAMPPRDQPALSGWEKPFQFLATQPGDLGPHVKTASLYLCLSHLSS